jgi:hypothetical protein
MMSNGFLTQSGNERKLDASLEVKDLPSSRNRGERRPLSILCKRRLMVILGCNENLQIPGKA